MRQFLDRAAVSFAAGAFGALINSPGVWAAGAYGLTASIGVAIAPALTAGWLYPRLVWGGLWGFLFLLPLRGSWYAARPIGESGSIGVRALCFAAADRPRPVRPSLGRAGPRRSCWPPTPSGDSRPLGWCARPAGPEGGASYGHPHPRPLRRRGKREAGEERMRQPRLPAGVRPNIKTGSFGEPYDESARGGAGGKGRGRGWRRYA